jgi:hypothetical protein
MKPLSRLPAFSSGQGETEEARLRELILPLQAVGPARGTPSRATLVSDRERESEDISDARFISAPKDRLCRPWSNDSSASN